MELLSNNIVIFSVELRAFRVNKYLRQANLIL